MDFVTEMCEGLRLVFSSLGVVRRAGMTWVYGVAALCFTLLLGIAILMGGAVSGWVADYIMQYVPEWLGTVVGFVVRGLVWLLSVWLVGLAGGCIILVMLSPALSRIALRAWQIEMKSGDPRPIEIPLGESVWRGVVVALRCTVQQLALMIVCFVLSFVPVVGIVAPVLSLGICAYFYGVAFADYAFEYAGFSAREDFSYANSHRGLMVGMGLPFALLLLIPVVGKYIALLFAPASAAAGAKLCLSMGARDGD